MAHKIARIKGDFLTEGGFLSTSRPRCLELWIESDGIPRHSGYGFELIAERYGDGDYITGTQVGWRFFADEGEFERLGIKFKLCGSAAVTTA